jgi:HPt (histidine-containing phosphotransfer) domain-containing protein
MGTDPHPAPAAQAPTALDAAAIARLRELDPSGQQGVVVRVLTTYDSSLRRLLAQLEAGRDQAATVASVAHTLKSSSASVGALRMAAACADIELRLRAGDDARLQDDVERLLREGRDTLCSVAELLKA